MLSWHKWTMMALATALALWPGDGQAQTPTLNPALPIIPVGPGVVPMAPAYPAAPVLPPGPPLWLAKFPANAVVPGSPYAPPPSGYTPPSPIGIPEPKNPRLSDCGLGCWSSHNRPTCSSLHSTATFIFGSCRSFFGEPCLQGPPGLAQPNGLGFRTNRQP